MSVELRGGADADPEVTPPVNARRVQHPLRVVAFVMASGLLLTATFALGYLVRSPNDVALEAAETVTPAIVRVEERVVDEGFSIVASLTAGSSVDIFVTEPSVEESSSSPTVPDPEAPAALAPPAETSSVARAVVSAGVVGSHVTYGSLLGEVSGRPVFAVPADVPLYRNLTSGDVGSDVTQLQRFLADLGLYGGSQTGTFDGRTLSSLAKLYADNGYKLPYVSPGVRGFGWREFANLPGSQLSVARSAAVGTVLSAEVPLVSVLTSAPSLSASLTVSEKDRLPPGSAIGVSIDGGPGQASSVTSVGVFITDEITGVSGYAASIAVPANVPIETSSTLRLVPLDSPPPSVAVPAIALRQSNGVVYVMKESAATSEDSASLAPGGDRVEVTVLQQAAGWVSIEPNERLPVGTRLLVDP